MPKNCAKDRPPVWSVPGPLPGGDVRAGGRVSSAPSFSPAEEAAARRRVFANYQVNDAVMRVADPEAMVLHCLPAHREEEITAEVFEAHANEIFDEAENRLHAQKAVLVRTMKG